MPNFATFNFDPQSLRIQIFGSATNAPINTDTDGMLLIRSISDFVSITATDLDIRALTSLADSILMYGADAGGVARSIRTDTDGMLQIRSISDLVSTTVDRVFTEVNFPGVVTADTYTGLDWVDTAKEGIYTFYVYNSGPNSANSQIEVSADQSNFFIDVSPRTIVSGSSDVFVPKTFLRYTRLAYQSAASGAATTLDVFVQLQS